jgi:hypothetical protein
MSRSFLNSGTLIVIKIYIERGTKKIDCILKGNRGETVREREGRAAVKRPSVA